MPTETRRFRKKPVVIEARRWFGDDRDWREFYDWCRDSQGVSILTGPHPTSENGLLVRVGLTTLEGTMMAEPGDWIIKGVKGEFYPCKPDIFEATYERVDDAGADDAD